MKEKKKMKTWVKVVLIIFGVLIFAFAALVGYFVYQDLQTESKINREVEEIENILNATDFDEELFKKKLNNTVSTGDYYKVERAYKNYLRDYYTLINDIIEFYDSIDVENILSIENIQTDGKDFVKTRITLDKYKIGCDKLRTNFDSMSDEKKVMSYLKSDLDDYYVDYYKKIIGDISQTSTEKELSEYLTLSSKQIAAIKDIFDFLSDNKSHWNTDGTNILFDSEELISQYQELFKAVSSISAEFTEEETKTEA